MLTALNDHVVRKTLNGHIIRKLVDERYGFDYVGILAVLFSHLATDQGCE